MSGLFIGKDFSPSQCCRCANRGYGAYCRAFPEGIPAEILTNRHDHRKPFPADNGILFQTWRFDNEKGINREVWGSEDLVVSQCATCRFRIKEDRCWAFPDTIPEEILDNRHDHQKPYLGDHGYRHRRYDPPPDPDKRSRFVSYDGDFQMSQCIRCKHKQGSKKVNGEVIPVCEAFPDGIPAVILEPNPGKAFNHVKPYPGDHGIQFEMREKNSS